MEEILDELLGDQIDEPVLIGDQIRDAALSRDARQVAQLLKREIDATLKLRLNE